MRKIIGIILVLVGIMITASLATAQLLPPPVVGGIVSANGVPLEDIAIRMDNLDNGEYREQTTAFENPPYSTAGGYAFCMPSQVGDIMQLTVYYEGLEYYGTMVLYTEQGVNWFNLSIDADAPPDDPPDEEPDPDPEPEPEPEPEEEPEDDPPEEEPDEEPEPEEQNESTLYSNLTVSVINSKTNNPIDNASVTVYDIETNVVAENNTNKSGNVTFQLEEGDYIVEAEKDDYQLARTRIDLLGSSTYAFSLQEAESQGNSNSYVSQNPTEGGFPYFYAGIAGAIVVAIILLFLFMKYK